MTVTHGGAKYTLSDRARELFQKQIESPVFDANATDGALGNVLKDLQQASPYGVLTGDAVPKDADVPAAAVAATTLLAMRSSEAIASGRRAVLRSFPGIAEPGGKLYPAARSDACWRDLYAFVRIVGYLCALGSSTGLSTRGFDVLRQVYDELDVPVDAVIVGVRGIRDHAIGDARLYAVDHDVETRDICDVIDKAFGSLLSRLQELEKEP